MSLQISDLDRELTEKFTAMLNEGTVPWHRPWAAGGKLPTNMATDNAYQGSNAVRLLAESWAKELRSPYWATYRQIDGLGGQVRRGEKGTPIVKWVERPVKDRDAEPIGALEVGGPTHKQFVPKIYYVFNFEQCDNLPEHFAAQELEPRVGGERIPEAEAAIDEYLVREGIEIQETDSWAMHFTAGASYSPGADRISLPAFERFETPEAYYSTALHEVAHSTGHASRLNRTNGALFGSPDYAREELAAELGSAMLRAQLGVNSAVEDEQSAAYLQSWLSALKSDETLISAAAKIAQQATNYVGVPSLLAHSHERDLGPSLVELTDTRNRLAETAQVTAPNPIERAYHLRVADVLAATAEVHRASRSDRKVAQEHVDVLTGEMAQLRGDGSAVGVEQREELAQSVLAEHAGDADALETIEAEIEARETALLAPLGERELLDWEVEIVSEHGVPGLARALDWRERAGVADPEQLVGNVEQLSAYDRSTYRALTEQLNRLIGPSHEEFAEAQLTPTPQISL